MPPVLIIVGGFLGSGKTTLLLEAASRLMRTGSRVALITNDQGGALVDTRLASVSGHRYRGDCGWLLLLPLFRFDRRRSAAAGPRTGRHPHGAGWKLHRRGGNRSSAFETMVRRNLPAGAVHRAGGRRDRAGTAATGCGSAPRLPIHEPDRRGGYRLLQQSGLVHRPPAIALRF